MGILAAFILAVIVFLLLPGGRQGTIGSLIMFFFILFLGGVAGRYWIVPFGPVLWGVSWLPILIFIFFVGFLFFVIPPGQRVTSQDDKEGGAVTASLFIWVLFLILLIAIGSGYYLAHR